MRCKVPVRFGGGEQSLSYYGWRGADINNILNFEADWPECEVIRLEENYRSVPDILACANTVIKHNVKRKDKTLWTANEDKKQTVIVNEYPDGRNEAYAIGRQIKDLRENDKYDYDDFVVLYRNNVQSRNFEEQFNRLGIPYKAVGSLAFYARAEIKDLLAYLALIENKKDDISFNRIINVPRRGLGDKSIQKLQDYANFKGYSLYEALEDIENIPTISGAVRNKFLKFRELMKNMKEESDGFSIDRKLKILYKRSGYEELLSKDSTISGESKKENIKELIESARESRNETVSEFLENAALSSTIDELDDSKKVTLMTIHSAKGLEFPVVFLTGLEENLMPSYQSIQKDDIEEERRLCYVAITRAKEHLYLSYARERYIYGHDNYQKPSRFLMEMPKDIVNLDEFEDDFYGHFKPSKESDSSLFKQSVHIPNETQIDSGTKVYSKAFGTGTVLNNEKGILTVAFPGVGIKKVSDEYVSVVK